MGPVGPRGASWAPVLRWLRRLQLVSKPFCKLPDKDQGLPRDMAGTHGRSPCPPWELDLDVEGSGPLQPRVAPGPWHGVPAWGTGSTRGSSGTGRRVRRPYLGLFSWRRAAPRAFWKLSPPADTGHSQTVLGPWAPGILVGGPGKKAWRRLPQASSVTADAIGHRSVCVGSTPRGPVPTLHPGHEADPRGPVHGPLPPGTGGGQALRREQLAGPRGARFAGTGTQAETVADVVQCSVPSDPSIPETKRPGLLVGGRQWTVASAPYSALRKSSLTSSETQGDIRKVTAWSAL